MKKNRLILLTLLASFLTTSCVSVVSSQNTFKSGPISTIPPYTPPTPPEPNKNIESIDVLNLPEDHHIDIGSFDKLNLKYQLNYDDGTNEQFPLTFADLPYAVQDKLGIPGTYTFRLMMRGVTYSFTLTMVDSGLRYTVRFLNYDGEILYETRVMPDNHVSYAGLTPTRMSDVMNKYKFDNWDQDLDTFFVRDPVTLIHSLYDVKTKINDVISMTNDITFIDEFLAHDDTYDEDMWYSAYYVGRMTNIPIVRGGYVNHVQGNNESIYYDFDMEDSPLTYDSLDYEDKHPLITDTFNTAINKSYAYDASEVPSEYKPGGERISTYYTSIMPAALEFELKSLRITSKEGKVYNTSIADYVDVVTNYLSDQPAGILTIPQEFTSGKYAATIFVDVDLYFFSYVTDRRPVDLLNSSLFYIACPCNIYVNINSEENRTTTSPLHVNTSTYDEDKWTTLTLSEIVRHSREHFES